MDKIKLEAEKLNSKVYAYQTNKGHFEIVILDENGKPLPKGFIIAKTENGVYNGELYKHLITELLNKFFEMTDDGLAPKTGKTEGKNIKIEVIKHTKFIEYLFNDELMFKLRLARLELRDNKSQKPRHKYIITKNAVNKTFSEITKFLEGKMLTTKEDFMLCRDLISAIDEYMLK